MKTYVLSVGGSAIIPDKIDVTFLKNLKKTISKLSKKNKLVIVCGGGRVARDYIKAAKSFGVPDAQASLTGIVSTKLNAALVSLLVHGGIFIPDSYDEIKRLLKKQNVVVCGALGFMPGMTSDGDAALIAKEVDAEMFINVTDVDGLFDKNPKQYKNARFIPYISFDDFWGIASKIKYSAGQHFVLDQSAAKVIRIYKIKTIIVKGLKNLENSIMGRSFKGTIIS